MVELISSICFLKLYEIMCYSGNVGIIFFHLPLTQKIPLVSKCQCRIRGLNPKSFWKDVPGQKGCGEDTVRKKLEHLATL